MAGLRYSIELVGIFYNNTYIIITCNIFKRIQLNIDTLCFTIIETNANNIIEFD